MMSEIFGLQISEGAIANLLTRVKGELESEVEGILKAVRSARLVCSDETSARVNGKNEWEWVFQNHEVCFHIIRPSRGGDVIRDVMGDHQPEVWVSDLYSSQKTHPAAEWQVCLAHQLRDCQYGIEAGDAIFSGRMKKLLLRAFVLQKRWSVLAETTHYQYRCRLYRDLDAVLALSPTQEDGIRLQNRYLDLRENLFLFLDDPSIPPTNNSSEQALRWSVIFRKITNGFRSDWGRDLFAMIRSIVNTGKRHSLSAFESILAALNPLESLFAVS
jgi:transposase